MQKAAFRKALPPKPFLHLRRTAAQAGARTAATRGIAVGRYGRTVSAPRRRMVYTPRLPPCSRRLTVWQLAPLRSVTNIYPSWRIFGNNR